MVKRMTTSETQTNKTIIQIMARLIGLLPKQQQYILGLLYQEQLTSRETALVLNLSDATVNELHVGSLQQLRQLLHKSDDFHLSELELQRLDERLLWLQQQLADSPCCRPGLLLENAA
jgi:hypothetical protein